MNLELLNDRQLQAVKETEGYVRVIAGAGTGKTRVLVYRYLYLVTELGIDPDSILCITFTRKARNEMVDRIRNELGPEMDLPYILTYHSFGSRFLKEEIRTLGYPSSFRIYDERDTRKVLDRIFEDHERKMDGVSLEEIKEKITAYKKKEEYVSRMMDRSYMDHILTKRKTMDDEIIDCYLLNQRKGRWLDFDDLVIFTHYILKHHEDIRKKWQDKFGYIEVDEAQDTSTIEYEILEMLSQGSKNLFVVGDPDQNIYEWRDSDNHILLDFDKVHPSCKTFILVDNYRSTKNILDASNRLISHNNSRVEKNLLALKNEGEEIIYQKMETETEQAMKIVSLIRESIERKEDYKDNAILFRCNFYSLALENTLRNEHIPYEVVGAPSFYELSEMKDIMALIRIILEEDDESLLRMINKPSRKFGKKKVEYLLSIQQDDNLLRTLRMHQNDIEFVGSEVSSFLSFIEQIQMNVDSWPVMKSLNRIIEDSEYSDYLAKLKNPSHYENMMSFLSSVSSEIGKNEKTTLREYYQGSLKKKEEESVNRNMVSLLTIHASKGLEFKNVYIVGLDEPFFPHYKTIEERKDCGLEEERRLLYVAMTRAMDRLYLFSSNDIGKKGEVSMFIGEIFPDRMNEVHHEKPKMTKNKESTEKKQTPKKIRKEKGVPNLMKLFDLK
jgi:DNA helicase II / ATP-dependent DNA helicase PcrA